MPNIKLLKYLAMDLLASSWKNWKIMARYPEWLLSELIDSILYLTMFLIGAMIFLPNFSNLQGSLAVNSLVWGFVFMVNFGYAIWNLGFSLQGENRTGTLEQVFLTPTSRLAFIVGTGLQSFVTGALLITILLPLINLLMGIPIIVQDVALLMVSYSIMIIMMLGFGIIFASLILLLRTPEGIGSLTYFLVMILASVFVPATTLQEPLRTIVSLFPLTYPIDMIRYSAIGTPTLFEPIFEFVLTGMISVGIFFFGLFIFRLIEIRLKRGGSLVAF
ncbi:MAG: ABC transporter permease [Candidatus Methylarchaceae archaeon HK01B]|nr:ABC transporter permease [Candidatus Methylarchaceae archaeon HK01B]